MYKSTPVKRDTRSMGKYMLFQKYKSGGKWALSVDIQNKKTVVHGPYFRDGDRVLWDSNGECPAEIAKSHWQDASKLNEIVTQLDDDGWRQCDAV